MTAQEEFEQKQGGFDLKKFLNLVLFRWYWILGSLAVAVGIAYLIVRYEDPVYVVSASFITKKFDDRLSANKIIQVSDEAASFRENIEVFQELPLLKSENRIRETLNRLNFGISYFVEGNFKTSEAYNSECFKVMVDSSSSQVPYGQKIYIDFLNSETYMLSALDPNLNSHFYEKTFDFGKAYDVNGWKFAINFVTEPKEPEDNNYFFVINNPHRLLNEYRGRLSLSWQRLGSSIIDATIRSKVPEKDYDFLTTYLQVVIEIGLEEKSEHITNTINFINEYMPQISDTIITYQKRLDSYKLNNREIINGSSFVFGQLGALSRQKSELMIANEYYDYIAEYIKQNKSEEVFAPYLIGLDEPPLNNLVNQYLELKWGEKADQNIYNEKNPLVSRSNEKYEKIEKNIYESIASLKEVNRGRMRQINDSINFYYRSIDDFQVESREYSKLQRMLALYESVFNNLITKRTEAFLSQASTISDYQIVTQPGFNKSNPVSPDKKKIFTIALLLGLGFPVGLLYLIEILNNRVISKDDLLNNTNIPLLGNVGHSAEKNNLVVAHRPRSLVSESFRGIRANLQYFESDKNVILVTSSVGSEGKTFCSINLAFTYALAGIKTVLIGADMRKPSLAISFQLGKKAGLSNYLAGISTRDEIIYNTENEYLQVIPGGIVPPNPAELLLSPAMESLVDDLKENYDIIIIDTPPIGLVADAMELLRFSTTNLLIVRQSKTFKKSLGAVTEMYNSGIITNLGIVFNDVDFKKLEYGHRSYGHRKNYGYGYGYGSGNGYGYYEEEPKRRGLIGRLLGKE